MQLLIQLTSMILYLLLAAFIAIIGLFPFYMAQDINFYFVIFPVLLVLISAFFIYFDQKLIDWRNNIDQHKKIKHLRCRHKFCWLYHHKNNI